METGANRYAALDGARGLAAFCVVLFHQDDWFAGSGLFRAGWLAVDFFFLLSGFIIAHAYEERLATGADLVRFARNRAIRLHPLLIAGTLLGAVLMLVEARLGRLSLPRDGAVVLLFSLVPLPTWWAVPMFPFDRPVWSLFWELFANLLYAVMQRFGSARLQVAMVAGSVLLLAGYRATTGGFYIGGIDGGLWLGAPRVCLSFFLGALLLRAHRRGWTVLPPVRGLGVGLLFCALAFLPARPDLVEIYYPAMVLIVFPAILLSTAASEPLFPKLARVSGDLSYPLYTLHVPVLRAISAVLIVAGVAHPGPPGLIGEAGRLLALVALSYAAFRLYDRPIRGWLQRRLDGPRRPVSRAPAARDTLAA